MQALLRILKKVALILAQALAPCCSRWRFWWEIWYVRPNRSVIDASLKMETWDAVADGTHNSNTDMIFWKDAFYMVHATSPFHFASSQSRLKVQRSIDARTWETIATFDAAGEDIRDPKFAAINDRLYLYALKNIDFTAEPHDTVAAYSQDGLTWSSFQSMSADTKGWLFWRPKTKDGQTWYVPAYWSEHNRSALFSSTDGLNWQMTAQIYSGDRNDETDIQFLPDGRMLATARLEFSDSYTGDRARLYLDQPGLTPLHRLAGTGERPAHPPGWAEFIFLSRADLRRGTFSTGDPRTLCLPRQHPGHPPDIAF